MTALLLALVVAATGIPRPVDAELTALAAARAAELTASGEFEHRPLIELDNGRWDGWGEVIGLSTYDDPLAGIVDDWMASPSHRAILANADFESIGCATAWSGERLFAVCVVADRRGAVAETPAPPVAPPITMLPDTAVAVP